MTCANTPIQLKLPPGGAQAPDSQRIAATYCTPLQPALEGGLLRGAEPMLEIVVVWISVFTIIEIFNRIRLGKIRWNGGSALDKIVGFSALLTDAQVTEMRSNSSQV